MICIARTCAQRGVLGFCIQDRVPAEHIERTARARSRAHARTRTFGAPLTVPAGSAARSASHTLSSGLSLPVTVGRGREVGGHVGVWMGGWEEGVGEWAAGPLVRASKLHHQSTAQPAPRARSTPERACAADVHDVTVPLHLHQSLHAHSAGRGHLPCAGVVVWASVCTCVCVCGGGASVCVCGGGEGCVVVRVGAWAATGPPAITVHVPHAHLTPPPPPGGPPPPPPPPPPPFPNPPTHLPTHPTHSPCPRRCDPGPQASHAPHAPSHPPEDPPPAQDPPRSSPPARASPPAACAGVVVVRGGRGHGRRGRKAWAGGRGARRAGSEEATP